jgi:hypothetical protein
MTPRANKGWLHGIPYYLAKRKCFVAGGGAETAIFRRYPPLGDGRRDIAPSDNMRAAPLFLILTVVRSGEVRGAGASSILTRQYGRFPAHE